MTPPIKKNLIVIESKHSSSRNINSDGSIARLRHGLTLKSYEAHRCSYLVSSGKCKKKSETRTNEFWCNTLALIQTLVYIIDSITCFTHFWTKFFSAPNNKLMRASSPSCVAPSPNLSVPLSFSGQLRVWDSIIQHYSRCTHLSVESANSAPATIH